MKNHFLICFVYRPPDSQISWYDTFETEMMHALSKNTNVMILGDFNIDFMKSIPSRWSTFLTTYGLHQLITEPTRVTASSVTLIDHIYTTNPENIVDISVPIYAPGDHYPISCTINKFSKLINRKSQHLEIKYRNFKSFNEDLFLEDLSKQPFDIVCEITDPNEALDLWIFLITNVLDKHAPVLTKRIKRKYQPEWFNDEIRDSIFQRDYFHKKKDFENYKLCRNKVTRLLRSSKSKFFKEAITSDRSCKVLWKHLRDMNSTTHHEIESLLHEGETINDRKDIVKCFNEHFCTVGENLVPNAHSTFESEKGFKLCQF